MSDDKVVSIVGGTVHTPPGDPVASVVMKLEAALADAKAGKLRSFVMAGIASDGAYMVDWSVEPDDGLKVLGTINIMRFRIEHEFEASS